MTKKKVVSLLALILVVFLWAVAPVFSKFIFDSGFVTPALLVTVRGGLSIIAMGIVLLITGGFKDFTKKYWVTIPAGLVLGAAYLFQFIGLDSTTPAKNTFLESVSCIAVPICMFIFIREKPSWMTIVSAIMCLGGSFILCGKGWDFKEMFTAPTIGDILSAIGGIFFGIDIAISKVYAKDKNPLLFVFFQLIILTIMSLIYTVSFEKGVTFSWDWRNIVIVLFLGIACTALCWVTRTHAIKNVGAVTCAVLMPMSAVLAALISIIAKIEAFSWNVIIGGLVITLSIVISGVYDAVMEKKEAKKNEQDQSQQ